MSTARRMGWALALGLSLQPACAVLVYPTELHTAWAAERWPDVTLAELQAGREAYVDICSGCHTLVRPETHAPEDWPDLVKEMEEEQEVRLEPAERQMILRYLEAASAIPVVPR